MTKSPPWPCRVCFWTCQNGGQAKSILIKLVLQKSRQKWCYPQRGDDGAMGSKGMAYFGLWGDELAGPSGRHHVWPLWPSECQPQAGGGAWVGEAFQRHG